MAINPAKNESKANQHAAGARFRQRKISVKQPLSIHKQRDLPSLDASELEPSQIHHLNSNNIGQPPRDIHAVDTGVDKNEEEEVHLQQVINAAQKALTSNKTNEMYIPTPDASKIWTEAAKYYKDQKFKEPESYIKFSATVEDTVGVEYNMDEEDEEFYNKNFKTKCSELEFETMCNRLEKTIEARQPFLSMDPTNILSYEEMLTYLTSDLSNNQLLNTEYLSTTALKEKLSKELNYKPFTTIFDKDQEHTSQIRPITKLFDLYGKNVYDHWKERKISRKGRSIQPTLRFEDPNANEKDNDNDPYICFRRREFRQARKTRRADTVGAERIRLLQKSLHRARDLIMSVCEREILNLDNLSAELDIFKLRSETKSVKRELGIRGDDYLFFPHKKRKMVKPKEDEEKKKEKKKIESQTQEAQQQHHQPQQASNPQAPAAAEPAPNQPYVKLPPAKIPDMELVTVSLVLRDKNDTIKRAVMEKLKKRKEPDQGFVNLTDDPFEPLFDISTNNDLVESRHIPYSSIAATNFHQFNTSNYLSEPLKTLIAGSKSLPGVKTIRGSNGELIPTKAFPHITSLLHEKMSNNEYNSTNYIAKLLKNIENNNYENYNNGFIKDNKIEEDSQISEPIFRLRKRMARANRMFIDRRGQQTSDVVDEFMNFSDDEEEIPNVYDSKFDAWKRLKSNWRFDDDLSEYQKGSLDPFSLDPSKLNNISEDTQAIRFGSMLLSKSYSLLKESVQQKQQSFLQSARMRALQQQQLKQHQQKQQQQQQQQLNQPQHPQVQHQQQSPPQQSPQQTHQPQQITQPQPQPQQQQPIEQIQKRSSSIQHKPPKPLSPAQNSINKPPAQAIH